MREEHTIVQRGLALVGVVVGLRLLPSVFLREGTTGSDRSPSSLPILPRHRAQRSGTPAVLGEAKCLCLFSGTHGALSRAARQSKAPQGPGAQPRAGVEGTLRASAAAELGKSLERALEPVRRWRRASARPGGRARPRPAAPAQGWQPRPRPPRAPGRSRCETPRR